MTWRPARCLVVLRDEINAAYPNRDRASDGIIGDQAHASRQSDHNPSRGVVHAIDIDKDGIPADAIVARLVRLGLEGDPRLRGGYVIWRGRIASHSHAWMWRDYTGSNRHDKHFHLSVTYDPACDSTAAWNVVPTSIPTEEPDVNERQNQIIENLEKRTGDIVGALGDIQKTLAAIRDDLKAAPGSPNTAPIVGKWTIDLREAD